MFRIEADSSGQAQQARRLLQFLKTLIVLNAGFLLVMGVLGWGFGSSICRSEALFLGLHAVSLFIALRAARAQEVARAANVLGYGLLCVALLSAALMPKAYPVLELTVIIAVVVVLSYVRGNALRFFVGTSVVATLAVTSIGIWLPPIAPSPPAWLHGSVYAAGVVVAVNLVLLLVWQLHSRLEAILASSQEATARAEFLSDVGAGFSASLDYRTTLRNVVQAAVPRIADICMVDELEPGGALRRVEVVHRDPAKSAVLQRLNGTFQLNDSEHPSWQAFATGKLVIARLDDAGFERIARNAEHLTLLRAMKAHLLVSVPLVAQGRPLGTMTFNLPDREGSLSPENLSLLMEVAQRAAMAMQNARLLEDRERSEALQRFLADGSKVLAESLDYQVTLESVARLMVEQLAHWCAVELEEPGMAGRVTLAVVVHRDPRKAALARRVLQNYSPAPNAQYGSPQVFRTGCSELYPVITDEDLRANAVDDEHYRLVRDLGLSSVIAAPMVVGGRTIGVLSLMRGEAGHHFSTKDLPLVEEIARRAALAVDNARLYREAKEAVDARDEFLSVASHELRTPLTSLELQVSNLARAVKDPRLFVADKVSAKVKVIDRQVDRLTTLIESLLDVSRIASGRLALDLRETDFREVLDDVVSRMREQITSSESEVVLSVPDRCLGTWDSSRLDQVVTNIISNAIKYGRGEPIEIRLLDQGDNIVFSVKDRGIGIDPEAQARIFERFERAVSERHFGGLGLGLWISKQIVTAMGGTVQVQSEPEIGSEFVVSLPRQQSLQAPAATGT